MRKMKTQINVKKKKEPKVTDWHRQRRTHILPLLQRLSLACSRTFSLVLVTFRPRCDKPVLCLVRHSVLGPYLHIAKNSITQAVRTSNVSRP